MIADPETATALFDPSRDLGFRVGGVGFPALVVSRCCMLQLRMLKGFRGSVRVSANVKVSAELVVEGFSVAEWALNPKA